MTVRFRLWVSPGEVVEVSRLVEKLRNLGWLVSDRGRDGNGRWVEFVGRGARADLEWVAREHVLTNYPEPVYLLIDDEDGAIFYPLGAGERSGLLAIADPHAPGGQRVVSREVEIRRRTSVGTDVDLRRQLRDAGVSDG